jgi:hypothetical protein
VELTVDLLGSTAFAVVKNDMNGNIRVLILDQMGTFVDGRKSGSECSVIRCSQRHYRSWLRTKLKRARKLPQRE